jgi:hypothetical protein
MITEDFLLVNRPQLPISLCNSAAGFGIAIIKEVAIRQVRLIQRNLKGAFCRSREIDWFHAALAQGVHDRNEEAIMVRQGDKT